MNNADTPANRKPGFYWCKHKARSENEPFQWNALRYWTAIDSRHHFSDDDFDHIGKLIQSPSEETPTSFDEVQDAFNKWQHKQATAYAFPGKFMGFVAGNEELIHTPGIEKRELIAAMIAANTHSKLIVKRQNIFQRIYTLLTGLGNIGYSCASHIQIAELAIKQADALLEQLEQTKP